MSIFEIHNTISTLQIDSERKYQLTFIVGQAYALEALYEACLKNGRSENPSIFYQAACELQQKFGQIAQAGGDFGVFTDYFKDFHTIFSNHIQPKEARVSYLD